MVIEPVKMDQVELAQTTHHHKTSISWFYTVYLCSVSCRMLPIKLCIDGKKIMSIP